MTRYWINYGIWEKRWVVVAQLWGDRSEGDILVSQAKIIYDTSRGLYSEGSLKGRHNLRVLSTQQQVIKKIFEEIF